jgi:hypothetical protein
MPINAHLPEVPRDSPSAPQASAHGVRRLAARPHLHVARQVVVEVRGLRGRSFGAAGAPDCVRSTVIHAASVLRPGAKYRVRFYARESRAGKASTLLATHTVAAHRFDSPREHPTSPRCGA